MHRKKVENKKYGFWNFATDVISMPFLVLGFVIEKISNGVDRVL